MNLKRACFCVVTGASRGIGRAFAVHLAAELGPGSLMVLMARDGAGLEETKRLAETADVRVEIRRVDLASASPEEMRSALASDGAEMESFDLNAIVHNVGSVGDVSLPMSRLNDANGWREYYDLNLFNVAILNNVFLEAIRGSDESVLIVNVSSKAGIVPFGGLTLYSTGKAARDMFFRVLAVERPDLNVLNYAAGPVETEMFETIRNRVADANLKSAFEAMKSEGKVLQPRQTVLRCIDLVKKGNYKSGDHVDYYD